MNILFIIIFGGIKTIHFAGQAFQVKQYQSSLDCKSVLWPKSIAEKRSEYQEEL